MYSDEALFYASAGHFPPSCIHPNNVVETLDTVDYLLGVDDLRVHKLISDPLKEA
jgi:serine phosphatase RsbU (regulator of sigma subunit)